MQDILLIQPPVGPLDLYIQPESNLTEERQMWKRRLTRIPQGLLSIATWLEQNGFRTKIFDCRLHLLDGLEQLQHDLRHEASQTSLIAGISVLTMHINSALQIDSLIKEVNPNLAVVWGGCHPTLFPEQTLADWQVDYIIQGEGEYPLQKFAEALSENRSADCIGGLGLKGHVNSLAKPFNPDLLDTPHWNSLEMEAYTTKQSYNPDRILQGIEYNGSRGCSYNCAFCINRVLPQQHTWRKRDPDKIGADIEEAKQRFGIKYVFFEEELPFHSMTRSLHLAQIMKDLDLQWYGNIRVDMVHKDSDLLHTLRRSGWTETSIGAESGSNHMLRYLDKGISVEQTLEAADILNSLDVYCLYSFMTDLPTETIHEKMATFRLMRNIKRIHKKSEFIGPQTYRPYPKTKFYEMQKASGEFSEPESLRDWVTSGLSLQYAM